MFRTALARWSRRGGSSGSAVEGSEQRRDRKWATVARPFLAYEDLRTSAANRRAQGLYTISRIVSNEKASLVVESRRKRYATAPYQSTISGLGSAHLHLRPNRLSL